jgi:poly-D-alanine transfer protein DltD
MSTNDKVIVFVLNPEPFIKAGVDPAKVQEWVFAKVEVKNKEGKKELVDKFLKPFNLK